jgi:hypothetical protein
MHTNLADSEFQVLQDEIEEMGISVNRVTKNKHVPEVERQNPVIKEWARAIIQTITNKGTDCFDPIRSVLVRLIYNLCFMLRICKFLTLKANPMMVSLHYYLIKHKL